MENTDTLQTLPSIEEIVIEIMKAGGIIEVRRNTGYYSISELKDNTQKELIKAVNTIKMYARQELSKDNIEKRKEKFTNAVLKTNRDNNILLTLEVLNTNGTSFIEYWTEHGENDRKMRFEKQASFDIKRRLLTWKNNNYNNAKPTYTDKVGEYLNR